MQQRRPNFLCSLSLISQGILSLFGCDSVLAQSAGSKEPIRPSNMIAEVEFNDGFLHHSGGSRIDVSRFNKGNLALPGNYRVDLYVNQAPSGKAEVILRQVGGDLRNVQPCMNTALLERIGVDLTKLSLEAQALLQSADKAERRQGRGRVRADAGSCRRCKCDLRQWRTAPGRKRAPEGDDAFGAWLRGSEALG